ncbi:hypothetical protein A0H81_11071 [Grifola frondosa]|uniref:Uncharacterized protein n=1 Tax=Grifola frondosa TaxID=5627 RepID=A0A1C7LX73_GRIFR|nr:hypothetical protein A0H81_11071 [Grifola frondosa]
MYEQQPNPAPRVKQQPPPDPNARSSHTISAQFCSKQMRQQPIPLAAPKPGYAAPVSALNLARPSPVATPEGRSPEMSEFPKPLTLVSQLPSTPHPLQPPMTPIEPVFARPSPSPAPRDVKRGQRGDDFWRRFSMVAKEELRTPTGKQSMWLRKTQNGTTRMSRWIWIIGMTLLIIIVAAIGLGWWASHNNTSHNAPTAIGGSANEKDLGSSSVSSTASTAATSSSAFHVTPTNTVARRSDPIPTAYALPLSSPSPELDNDAVVRAVQSHRARRSYLNRTIH